MFGTNKPAYNKPGSMKPMKPTGGPMPMFPGNKPKPMTGGPMPKPSKSQMSLDAIKRRLQG